MRGSDTTDVAEAVPYTQLQRILGHNASHPWVLNSSKSANSFHILWKQFLPIHPNGFSSNPNI